jgi:hypothetical protein
LIYCLTAWRVSREARSLLFGDSLVLKGKYG